MHPRPRWNAVGRASAWLQPDCKGPVGLKPDLQRCFTRWQCRRCRGELALPRSARLRELWVRTGWVVEIFVTPLTLPTPSVHFKEHGVGRLSHDQRAVVRARPREA